MTSESPKNFEAPEHPLTQEEKKQLLDYFQKHPDEARAVLSRVASTAATQANQIKKLEQTTNGNQDESFETESFEIPAELGDLEKFGDFLKEKLAEKTRARLLLFAK